MTKLLHKPLRAFAFYSLIILLISIPVYVWVVDYIWISELDENNWLTLQRTKEKIQKLQLTSEEIQYLNQNWGELQPGVSIVRTEDRANFQDSVYEVIRSNEYGAFKGEDRFRGLKSSIKINGTSYILTIETNVEESNETFAAVAIMTLVFFILLIIGFIILNHSIASKSWKPFYDTLKALKSFELSRDSTLNLPSSDIQEFQDLNQSLLSLVKRNVNDFQQQKSFFENASHELQTPVALLKSKFDILLQQKEVPAEILNGIEAPLARLSRINKNLLLLAKVENYQYTEKTELDLKERFASIVGLFEDYAKEKEINMNTNIQESIVVEANSFLLETLIHNLLSNAIRHATRGGQILISSQGRLIRVDNSGKESLSTQHLFKRFSTTNKSKVSSGLGLAIIKEISNQYGWKVSYEFKSGLHSFSIAF